MHDEEEAVLDDFRACREGRYGPRACRACRRTERDDPPIGAIADGIAERYPDKGLHALVVTLARAAGAALGSIAADHNTTPDKVLQDFMLHLRQSQIERRDWPEND